MTIEYEKLMAIDVPDGRQHYDERDTMLYALSLGYGHDPLDEGGLAYCYEVGLKAAPTLPLVLCHPGFWLRDLDTGVDWRKVVHGEQALELHAPIPVTGTVISHTHMVDIIDKGEGRGAVIIFDRTLHDADSGTLIATIRQTNFCRGDGGFGGPPRSVAPAHPIPEGSPDHTVRLPTRPETALLYRLSADPNPLHADPAAARLAGFTRPILHGMATFAIAAHAVVKAVCDYDANRLQRIAGRFTDVVYPGETITTEMWRDGDRISFRAVVAERDAVVMNNGLAIVN